MSDDTSREPSYRQAITWSTRLERERPFLMRNLAGAPTPSVLDVGCGSGEHAALLHDAGWRALGIDKSEDMVREAKELARPPDLDYHVVDFASTGVDLGAAFGAALALGNVLPFIDDEGLPPLLDNVRRHLQPGGVFLFQLLNYERVRQGTHRAMPLKFIDDEDGEVVFARIFRMVGDRHVVFRPTSLLLPDDPEAPLSIRSTRSVLTRAWSKAELSTHLATAGFAEVTWYGTVEGDDFEPDACQDLIGLARVP